MSTLETREREDVVGIAIGKGSGDINVTVFFVSEIGVHIKWTDDGGNIFNSQSQELLFQTRQN